MSGTFSKSARPVRPGAYFNFVAATQVSIPPAAGSVVALPFTADWGPVKTPTSVGSLGAYQAIFGPTLTTDGYKAVKQCFQGEGLPGRGGAGTVIAYRMAGSAVASATKVLQNTTPVNALTLTAKFPGTYGNNLSVTVQTNALDGTKKDLLIILSGVTVETYTWTSAGGTALAGIAAIINSSSGWVTAVVNLDGTPLTNVSNQSLTGGNDGTTLVSGDWTTAMSDLETQRFTVLSPYNLTDAPTLASLFTWAQNLNTKGKRFFTVVGGAAGEDTTTANTRSATFNDHNFINLGFGTITDATFGALGTAQIAPRIAGILAAKGESQSLTYARLAGTTLTVGPTEANILTAFTGGTTVFSKDSHPLAPVRVEKALTTYTGGDVNRPYLIFRNPKYVRTMQLLETELTAFFEQNAVGLYSINQKTREFVIGQAKASLKAREAIGSVQAGWTVEIDQNPPPTDDDEFVALVYGIKFGRSLEQVYGTVNIA